jgi:hypothetical protein
MTIDIGNIIDLVGIVVVPVVYLLFRSIRNIEMKQEEQQGNHKVLDEKVHHIEGNYKQGIEYVKETMHGLKSDISELKTVMMEILTKK